LEPLVRDLAAVKGLDADFTPDGLKVISRLMSKLEAGDLPLGELEALHRKAGLAITKNRVSNPADAAAAGAIAQKVDEFVMNLPDDAIVSGAAGKDARSALTSLVGIAKLLSSGTPSRHHRWNCPEESSLPEG
jgi:hypothetical protein